MTHPFKSRISARSAKLALACLIALPAGGTLPAAPSGYQLIYQAKLADGSLVPSIDTRKLGNLVKGDSGPGAGATWTPFSTGLTIAVTQPAGATEPSSAGVWVTPVKFGPGSKFALEATFVSPRGPDAINDLWAVALAARTGDRMDAADAVRAGATLQVRGPTARLNGPGLDPGLGLMNISQANYDRLFKQNTPVEFTLEFVVDRATGKGKATLKVAGVMVATGESSLADFKATSGQDITTVGAGVVIARGQGKSASVQIREFKIYSGSNT